MNQTLFDGTRSDTPFPPWAKRRDPPWIYTGWIDKSSTHFDKLVAMNRKSDHGEARIVDVYPQGAVCYYHERLLNDTTE